MWAAGWTKATDSSWCTVLGFLLGWKLEKELECGFLCYDQAGSGHTVHLCQLLSVGTVLGCFVFSAGLFRYNQHTMSCTYWKCHCHQLWHVCTCENNTMVRIMNKRTDHVELPCAASRPIPASHNHWLAVTIDQLAFLEFYINGIIQCVLFSESHFFHSP